MISTRYSQILRQSRRAFSSQCAPAQKLRETFEDYRKTHFSRETKTRFRKELVKSIAYDGVVQKDSLNRVLTNIGRKDRILTDEEFHTLCKEAGDGSALLTTSMMKLFQ